MTTFPPRVSSPLTWNASFVFAVPPSSLGIVVHFEREGAEGEGKQILSFQGWPIEGNVTPQHSLTWRRTVRVSWAQISRVEARIVFSELKWTLFCFCRLILLVRGHFLVMQSTTTQMMTTWRAPMIEAMRT